MPMIDAVTIISENNSSKIDQIFTNQDMIEKVKSITSGNIVAQITNHKVKYISWKSNFKSIKA